MGNTNKKKNFSLLLVLGSRMFASGSASGHSKRCSYTRQQALWGGSGGGALLLPSHSQAATSCHAHQAMAWVELLPPEALPPCRIYCTTAKPSRPRPRLQLPVVEWNWRPESKVSGPATPGRGGQVLRES